MSLGYLFILRGRMEIEYNLTEADILALAICRMNCMPKFRKNIRLRRILYLSGFVLMAIGSYPLGYGIIESIIFAILGISIFFGYPYYVKWQIKRRAHNECQKPKVKGEMSNRFLRINDDWLEDGSSLAKVQIKWEAIHRVYLMDNHTFLSVEDSISIVVPKNGIKSGDYVQFVEFLKQKTLTLDNFVQGL
jgi:hypothetical protein